MKKGVLCLMLCFLSLGWYAFTVVESSAINALQRVGLTQDEARLYVWSGLSSGYLSYPSAAVLKQIPANERGAFVLFFGSLARDYTESPEFSRKYLEYREQAKPSAPEPPASADEDRKRQREELERSIRETEKNMKSVPADQQAMIQDVIAMLQEQLKLLDDPDNFMFGSEMEAMKRQNYEQSLEQHRLDLAKWETRYPLDPKLMLRQRLAQVLEESKGVDFDAKLKPGGNGKDIFENPAYEAKPANWKLCYRAGREAVEPARVFAQRWLDDLN